MSAAEREHFADYALEELIAQVIRSNARMAPFEPIPADAEWPLYLPDPDDLAREIVKALNHADIALRVGAKNSEVERIWIEQVERLRAALIFAFCEGKDHRVGCICVRCEDVRENAR